MTNITINPVEYPISFPQAGKVLVIELNSKSGNLYYFNHLVGEFIRDLKITEWDNYSFFNEDEVTNDFARAIVAAEREQFVNCGISLILKSIEA